MKSTSVLISLAVVLLSATHTGVATVVDGAVDVTQPPYNAVGDGSTNDTAAITKALNTGHTVYLPATSACYLVQSDLVMSTKDQIMYGDGRTRSRVCPLATSTTFVHGVITFTSGEAGPQLRDLGIIFTQPSSASSPSQMTKYVPAIYAENTPRFKIEHVRISAAWTGIDMSGNSGGALIDDLEISAFNWGIWVDGSQDTVRINNVHSWPFDLTPAQTRAFYYSSVTSFYIGRCDDCEIANALTISGTGMQFFAGSGGMAPFALISNSGFDTNNGVSMSAGTIQMSSVYFTLIPSASVQAINMTGGSLNVSNFWALAGPTSVPMVQVSGSAILNMSNGNIQIGRQNATFLLSQTNGGIGHIGLMNNYFNATANVSHSNPLISITGGPGMRVQAFGNQVSDKGTGSGTFWSIAYDDFHRIIGNTSIGWANSFPTSANGVYQNN
jgi:hypothetical protein